MKRRHRIKPTLTIRGHSGFNLVVHRWRLVKAPKGPYAAFQTVTKRQGKPWVRHMAKSLPKSYVLWFDELAGLENHHQDAIRYLNGEFAADADL